MGQPLQVFIDPGGTYLLTCQRYIELNPVRAAMVDDPAHYRWTSYRANGLGQSSQILTPHRRLPPLFRAQLDKAAIGDIRLALNQNQPLGNERFYARIEKLTGQRREAKPQGRPRSSGGETASDEEQRELW